MGHMSPARLMLYDPDPATVAMFLYRSVEELQVGDFCMYLCRHQTFSSMVCVLTRASRCLMVHPSFLVGCSS